MTSKAANFECCMCGDSGLSYELFRCKVCQFRSQHRYCSNLYPKAESYRVCNWCLIQKGENAASNPSSPYKADQDLKSCKKKGYSDHHKMGGGGGAASKSAQPVSPIKKQRVSPEAPSPPPSSKKRVVVAAAAAEGAEERMIRRTRSEEIMANGSVTPVTRHVFRNKVRRYKLLEEVSS